MFISSEVLGNILCKQLADILKYFPLLKSNNKNLYQIQLFVVSVKNILFISVFVTYYLPKGSTTSRCLNE